MKSAYYGGEDREGGRDMKDQKMKDKHSEIIESTEGEPVHSALDLWRHMGGQSHRVPEQGQPPPDSMLAAYGDRVTYTFIMEEEVASIHFDRRRQEIFFKGHNVRHLEMTDPQLNALNHLKEVIKNDPKAKSLFSDYCATLDRFLADNKNRGRV